MFAFLISITWNVAEFRLSRTQENFVLFSVEYFILSMCFFFLLSEFWLSAFCISLTYFLHLLPMISLCLLCTLKYFLHLQWPTSSLILHLKFCFSNNVTFRNVCVHWFWISNDVIFIFIHVFIFPSISVLLSMNVFWFILLISSLVAELP